MLLIFNEADDCIKSACNYINKSGEKCEVLKNDRSHLSHIIIFEIQFPNACFKLKHNIANLINYRNPKHQPLMKLILDKYGSIEDFVNNHSKLITFL